jgi:hypothetical protein
MIDQTYGHLARDADHYDRGLLDAYDEVETSNGHVAGTIEPEDDEHRDSAEDAIDAVEP